MSFEGYGDEYDKSNNKKNKLQQDSNKEIKARKKRLRELELQLEQLELKNEETKVKEWITNLKNEENKLNEEIIKLNEELESLSVKAKQHKTIQEKHDKMKFDITEHLQQRYQRENAIKKLDDEKMQKVLEIKELESQIKQLKENINVQKDNTQTQDVNFIEFEKKEKELEEKQKELEKKFKDQQELDKKLKEKEKELEEKQKELEKKLEEKQELEKKLEEKLKKKEDKIKELEERLKKRLQDKIKEEKLKLQQQNKQELDKLKEYEEKNKYQAHEITTLMAAQQKLEKEIHDLSLSNKTANESCQTTKNEYELKFKQQQQQIHDLKNEHKNDITHKIKTLTNDILTYHYGCEILSKYNTKITVDGLESRINDNKKNNSNPQYNPIRELERVLTKLNELHLNGVDSENKLQTQKSNNKKLIDEIEKLKQKIIDDNKLPVPSKYKDPNNEGTLWGMACKNINEQKAIEILKNIKDNKEIFLCKCGDLYYLVKQLIEYADNPVNPQQFLLNNKKELSRLDYTNWIKLKWPTEKQPYNNQDLIAYSPTSKDLFCSNEKKRSQVPEINKIPPQAYILEYIHEISAQNAFYGDIIMQTTDGIFNNFNSYFNRNYSCDMATLLDNIEKRKKLVFTILASEENYKTGNMTSTVQIINEVTTGRMLEYITKNHVLFTELKNADYYVHYPAFCGYVVIMDNGSIRVFYMHYPKLRQTYKEMNNAMKKISEFKLTNGTYLYFIVNSKCCGPPQEAFLFNGLKNIREKYYIKNNKTKQYSLYDIMFYFFVELTFFYKAGNVESMEAYNKKKEEFLTKLFDSGITYNENTCYFGLATTDNFHVVVTNILREVGLTQFKTVINLVDEINNIYGLHRKKFKLF